MKDILIYDIALCPLGMTMEEIVKVFKEEKTVVYDSSNSPRATIPHIINMTEEIEFKDLKDNEYI